jgi:hypothetical protein
MTNRYDNTVLPDIISDAIRDFGGGPLWEYPYDDFPRAVFAPPY